MAGNQGHNARDGKQGFQPIKLGAEKVPQAAKTVPVTPQEDEATVDGAAVLGSTWDRYTTKVPATPTAPGSPVPPLTGFDESAPLTDEEKAVLKFESEHRGRGPRKDGLAREELGISPATYSARLNRALDKAEAMEMYPEMVTYALERREAGRRERAERGAVMAELHHARFAERHGQEEPFVSGYTKRWDDWSSELDSVASKISSRRHPSTAAEDGSSYATREQSEKALNHLLVSAQLAAVIDTDPATREHLSAASDHLKDAVKLERESRFLAAGAHLADTQKGVQSDLQRAKDLRRQAEESWTAAHNSIRQANKSHYDAMRANGKGAHDAPDSIVILYRDADTFAAWQSSAEFQSSAETKAAAALSEARKTFQESRDAAQAFGSAANRLNKMFGDDA